ncbi:hypothetical protein P9209_11550 [Prescottella defluvii]|nr:hypothetical protein P9209_11550 [Prescottella defluvii]
MHHQRGELRRTAELDRDRLAVGALDHAAGSLVPIDQHLAAAIRVEQQ